MKKNLLVGLILGMLLGFGTGVLILPFGPTPPRWIVFPNKYFFHPFLSGDITFQGRINDTPDYPNNVVHITCRQFYKACEMIKVEEIDKPERDRYSLPQIGDIHPPEIFEVIHWDKSTITAVSKYSDTCELRQLNVDFAKDEAEIVMQPQNLTDMQCKNTNPNLVRYPLEERFKP